jgi:hypothetical protein
VRASRIGALGYVIVVLMAVLNKMGSGFIITPAEAAFVPFGEGASVINNDAKEEVFGVFHGRYSISLPVFIYEEGTLDTDGEDFAQSIPFFSRFHDWGSQQIVGVVDSRRAVRVRFANAEASAHVFDDCRRFSVVCNTVCDKGSQGPAPLDPVHCTPKASPSAGSPDRPSLHLREQSSSMKNRTRETCTSGTVRDEGGNILIYSANDRGIEETSASFEARSAPRSYPTQAVIEPTWPARSGRASISPSASLRSVWRLGRSTIR